MKPVKYVIVALIAVSGLLVNVKAQSVPERKAAPRILDKTNLVVSAAYNKVKENKNFTGDLSKAVAHQRFAKKLYMTGQFHRAIHQARIAREYAIKAIKANKGEDFINYKYTPEDEEILKNGPGDAELEAELMKDSPNEKLTDEDLIKSNDPGIDKK